jgi:hypothetical protein
MDDTEIHFVGDDIPKKSMKEILAEKKRMMDEKKSLTADEIQKKRNDEEKKKNDEIEEQKSKQLKFEKVKQMLAIAQKKEKHLEYKNTIMKCKCGKEFQRQFKARHLKTKFHLEFFKGE